MGLVQAVFLGCTNGSYGYTDEDWVPDEPERVHDTGESCDDTVATDLFLSPDDSNSMSSPVQARVAVLGGGSLDSVNLRTYEFMNYYGWDYEPPASGLALSAALKPDPKDDSRFVLQIGVTSPSRTNAERGPLNLVFSVDRSGSMDGQPISLVKTSIRSMASQLRSGDTVSMVGWSDQRAILLEGLAVTGPSDPTLLDAVESINAGGATDLEAGLEMAYGLAEDGFRQGSTNRVVLLSDGGANLGETSAELIALHAQDGDDDTIYMVGVGVGEAGDYHDSLMDAVTDAGKGAALFIPDDAEATLVFEDRFVNTMDVAARDVGLALRLPPGFEVERFSGEEMSENRAEVDAQHLAPNDTMVFHLHLKTCAPEMVSDETELEIEIDWIDPSTGAASDLRLESTFGALAAEDQDMLLKGKAVFAYAEALKTRKNGQGASTVSEAREAVEEALTARPSDPDLLEIQDVLDRL